MKQAIQSKFEVSMGNFQLEVRSISKLKAAPYQPSSRTLQGNLTSLQQAVQKTKIVYPIIVLPNGTILDGHRRVAVLRNLYVDSVECLVYRGKESPVKLFVYFQSATRRISSNEWMQMYLQSGELPPSPQTATAITHLEELFGRVAFKSAVTDGLSLAILEAIRTVETYLKLDRDKSSRKKLLLWMWNHHMMERARWWAFSGSNPQKLLQAINSDTPLPELTRSMYVPKRRMK